MPRRGDQKDQKDLCVGGGGALDQKKM